MYKHKFQVVGSLVDLPLEDAILILKLLYSQSNSVFNIA